MQFIPSSEQQAIFDYVLSHINDEGRKALAVKAGAGTGKTSTIIQLIHRGTDAGHDITGVYCAFNKDIVTEVEPKLEGTNIRAKTFHSLSMGSLIKHLKSKYKTTMPKDFVDANKYRDLINSYIDQNPQITEMIEEAASFEEDTDAAQVRKVFVNGAFQLCHFMRVRLEGWNDKEKLGWIVHDYQLDDPLLTYELIDEMIAMQPIIMSQGEELLKKTGLMDFDDMIYWICKWDIHLWQNKWVFVDEAQDLSPMQRMVVSKVLDHKNGFIVIVGDTGQAIYKFAGADSDSFDRTVKWFKADILPLSVTRRCDKIIAHHAAQHAEDFKPLETAERGKLIWLDDDDFADHVRPGDMVICRVKAPLIGKAIECIAKEIPAVILGGNIGTSLIDLMEIISKRDGFRWSEPLKAVESYQFVRVMYFLNKEDEAAADSVRDDCEAIKVLLENSKAINLQMFADYVNNLFSDKDGAGKVILCTGHKSKGLEANRVFILQPEKMPLIYMGMHPEDVTQEKNLQYVAWTRAKHELVYLTNDKFMEAYENGKEIPSYVQYDFIDHNWSEDGLYMLDDNGNTVKQLPSGSTQPITRPAPPENTLATPEIDFAPETLATVIVEDDKLIDEPMTIEIAIEEKPLSAEEAADIGYAPTSPFVKVEMAGDDEVVETAGVPIPPRVQTCYTVYFEAETDDGLDLQNPQNFDTDDEVADYLKNLLKTLPYQYVVHEYLTRDDRDNGDTNNVVRADEWLIENDYSPEPNSPLDESSAQLEFPSNPVVWAQFVLEHKDQIVILDTETTTWATDKENCEVIQLAIIDLDGNPLVNQKIKPHQAKVSKGASDIHGITDAMLVNEKTIENYLPYIRDAIEGKYVIAYNSPFDEQAMENAYFHANIEAVPVARWLCAMRQYSAHNPNKVTRGRRGGWWKLTEAVEQQRLTAREDAHDALADVTMTLDLIKSMAQDHENRWQNKHGYCIGDIVEVRASGAYLEVLKTMPNGELNLRDVNDDARHTMPAGAIDLVTPVEQVPVMPVEEESIIEIETPEPVVETAEVIAPTEPIQFNERDQVITRTGHQGTVVSHADRYVQVQVGDHVSAHYPHTLAPELEPVEIMPVIVPENPYKPVEDWFISNVQSRDEALRIVDLLQAIVEEVYPV